MQHTIDAPAPPPAPALNATHLQLTMILPCKWYSSAHVNDNCLQYTSYPILTHDNHLHPPSLLACSQLYCSPFYNIMIYISVTSCKPLWDVLCLVGTRVLVPVNSLFLSVITPCYKHHITITYWSLHPVPLVLADCLFHLVISLLVVIPLSEWW